MDIYCKKIINDKNYFAQRVEDEKLPITPNEESNKRSFLMEKIFNFYFPDQSDVKAKDSAQSERNKKNLNTSCFVYGEITFRSIAYIFEYLKSEKCGNIIEGNFYDMGSGTGKGVIAAALCHKFKKCIGIEYLEGLTKISIEETLVSYNANIKQHFNEHMELFKDIKEPNEIYFKQGDFTKEKWEEPSVLLFCSTCFSPDLMVEIGKKANKECPKGAIIITFTKRVPGLTTDWDFHEGFRIFMNYGTATVFIHIRK